MPLQDYEATGVGLALHEIVGHGLTVLADRLTPDADGNIPMIIDNRPSWYDNSPVHAGSRANQDEWSADIWASPIAVSANRYDYSWSNAGSDKADEVDTWWREDVLCYRGYDSFCP